MNNNDFLTIQEFIQKYDVADIRIRRRIRKYKLVDPQKLEGNLSERHDKGVGNIILLKEVFWVKELEAVAKETAYAEPLKRSPKALKRSDENEPNRLSGTPDRLSGTAYAVPPETPAQAELNRLSEFALADNQVAIDKEFLEILKEDRAEKKDWIIKYDSLLGDYKAKDNELVEREKFLQGLIEKVISDARQTKQLLASQINHLQKQLHAPKKEEGIEFENGNFTEAEENESTDA
jgi:hypothetical protein